MRFYALCIASGSELLGFALHGAAILSGSWVSVDLTEDSEDFYLEAGIWGYCRTDVSKGNVYCADFNSLSHNRNSRLGSMIYHSVEMSSETLLILKTTSILSFIISIFSILAAYMGNKYSQKCEESKKSKEILPAIIWLSGALIGFGISLLLLFSCLLVYVSSYGSLRYDYLDYDELQYKWSRGVIYISVTLVLKIITIIILHFLGFLTISSLSKQTQAAPIPSIETSEKQDDLQSSEFMIKQGRSPSVFSVDTHEGRQQVRNSPYMRHLMKGQKNGAPGMAYQMEPR
ncbi:Oidioi.mRNA.OKI2018_I69.chr1.g405.t1.cds [Oikopleura dioica]|uniref:Oidioi.mRNA.OKI2018_I69.chr1.g405.t1.cds n=1 Tax=Oikopleura dioica TaxID=34765 RepID=A0ABN7SJS1_OIKDI|nr:Oidioi.mRNA.OKI2018_I69.chr1.g405.t1.cds [Oikopleura dioica]